MGVILMMEIQGFSSGLVIKEADVGSDSGDTVEFNGVITNNRLDSGFERMGEGAMRSFARDLKTPKAIKVLPEHNHASQPIGRSLSGSYNPVRKEVTSKFYIQKGLDLRAGFNGGGYANTDSYIEAASMGTASDLSIGALIDKETCDHCSSEMKRFSFLGMTFIEDSNGHHPGQTIYVDKKGNEFSRPKKGLTKKVITATIEKAQLMEFSLVAFGAVPGAEVQKELIDAWASGELKLKHLEQLNDRFSIKAGSGGLVFPISPQDSAEGAGRKNSSIVVPKSIGGSRMDQDRMEEQLEAAQALNEEYKADRDALIADRDALKERVTELEIFEESHNEVTEQISQKEEEVKSLKDRLNSVRDNEWKADRYNKLLVRARDAALKQFVRSKADVTDTDREREQARLSTLEDYDTIMEWEGIYKTRARDRVISSRGTRDNLLPSEKADVRGYEQ